MSNFLGAVQIMMDTIFHLSEAHLKMRSPDAYGQEVVQLYVGARDSKVERANKELKAFTKVALAPGQTRVLQLEVPVQELAYYDSQSGWVVEPGNYEVIVGTHSADKNALRSSFCIS